MARTIHHAWDEWDAVPLVPLSCSLLDVELLQSTVSEVMQRCGELDIEHPPTLLLLDVDKLTADVQAGLLEILKIRQLDFNALATSEVSAEELSRREGVLPELIYRLATLEIVIPGLDARRADIPLLVQARLEHLNARGDRQIQGVRASAMDLLVSRPWPRNIDELYRVVDDAHAAAKGVIIAEEDFPREMKLTLEALAEPARQPETLDLDAHLQDVERQVITRALDRAKGNKAEASRHLGISRARLLRRLEQLEIG